MVDSEQNGVQNNEQNSSLNDGQDTEQNSDQVQKPTESVGTKESLYDKIPITKKQLDILIIILFIALIGFLVFGVLVGNGIL